MVEKKIRIRKAFSGDEESIFYLYARYMFGSYLIEFNPLFVKNYLKAILGSKNCITLVAEDERTIGFIMGTLNSRKLSGEMFFNPGVIGQGVRNLFSRPGLLLKSLDLFFYPRRTRLADIQAELLFIAIEPGYRDQGLAAKLIQETLSLMRQKGIRQVKVSTLADNRAVNAVLGKLRFRMEKPFKLFGKRMYLYSFPIDQENVLPGA